MSDLPTISDAAGQIRSGRLHPRELVERCLAQIRACDGRLHAWVEVDETGARRDAESLGRELASGGGRGPLHGIPLGIKDIIDVAGMHTRAGSPLRANHRAATDAPLVAALRRAGAIVLGKTVTVEFACFDPSPTRNPWDPALQHTPGGSSSGSAVAALMGMCLGALGTQTGGSLVRPAAYCGIATCKPTFGLLSREGIVPVSYHLDHPGPMARSVADLAIMLRVCGTAALGCAERFAQPRVAVPQVGTSATLPPRLGWLQGFFVDEADAAIRAATETAIAQLRAGGATVEPAAVPNDFRQVPRCTSSSWRSRRPPITARRSAHRDAYGPMIAELLDEGLGISAVNYAERARLATAVHSAG